MSHVDEVAITRYIIEVIWQDDPTHPEYVVCKSRIAYDKLMEDLRVWVPEKITVFTESYSLVTPEEMKMI